MKLSGKKWIEHWSSRFGLIDPKRYIGDIVLKNRIELLEQQIRKMKREKEKLEKENIRLQKALNKKDLNLLKNL